jgi:DNA-binding NarL/FixJ family response regulator
MGKVRILLADDHETILAGVRSILCDDFEVVGTVGNGRDAVKEVRRLDPDVLVIDISMPVLDGLQAASQLHRKECRTKVVFLTVHEDQDYVDAAMAAGASGYVTKSRIQSDLVPAIREALIGHTYISKSIKP